LSNSSARKAVHDAHHNDQRSDANATASRLMLATRKMKPSPLPGAGSGGRASARAIEDHAVNLASALSDTQLLALAVARRLSSTVAGWRSRAGRQ